MDIFYQPRFKREYKKLPADLRELTKERVLIFQDNPFDPRLKTHKLHGRLQGRWAFSIDYHHRIVFSFISEKIVRFLAIGTHGIYE